MNKAIAYHEAGHAMACILFHVKFTLVSIKQDAGSQGWVKFYIPKIEVGDITNPIDFNKIHTFNFIELAGFIAEKLCIGHNKNVHGSLCDFLNLHKSLSGLSESLIDNYIAFLSEYIRTIFQFKNNWLAIETIAKALQEKGTLSQDEVFEALLGVPELTKDTL